MSWPLRWRLRTTMYVFFIFTKDRYDEMSEVVCELMSKFEIFFLHEDGKWKIWLTTVQDHWDAQKILNQANILKLNINSTQRR